MRRNVCECGCGGIVSEFYKNTDYRQNGHEKGKLKRFLPGHQLRDAAVKRWADYIAASHKQLNGKKVCGCCQKKKDLTEFYPSKIGLYRRSGYCRQCTKKSNQEWYAQNPGWQKSKNASLYQRAKKKVFDHYGRKCKCCGEEEPMFLSIDHVNNDGGGRNRAERGYVMYRNIVDQGFPKAFQVLCWNCNVGKQRNDGVCPHIKDRVI